MQARQWRFQGRRKLQRQVTTDEMLVLAVISYSCLLFVSLRITCFKIK